MAPNGTSHKHRWHCEMLFLATIGRSASRNARQPERW
jgi:hypothetical protein